MISNQDIAEWGLEHPWQDADQVEQDLLLSQAMCAVANHRYLSKELRLRGGTAFHKLFMPEPYRYSEDLDYVRATAGGIGDVMKALTAMGRNLGYDVRTSMQRHPKVFWRFERASGLIGKIKIEIDTYERSPMLEPCVVSHRVANGYCEAFAEVPTFQVEELVATKIRALYQRSKGRDLYDIWLALHVLGVAPEAILAAFPAYRPDGMTRAKLERNLAAKLEDPGFRSDVEVLRRRDSPAYDAREAGLLVLGELVGRL